MTDDELIKWIESEKPADQNRLKGMATTTLEAAEHYRARVQQMGVSDTDIITAVLDAAHPMRCSFANKVRISEIILKTVGGEG